MMNVLDKFKSVGCRIPQNGSQWFFEVLSFGYIYGMLVLFFDLTDYTLAVIFSMFVWNIFRRVPSYYFLFPGIFFIAAAPLFSFSAVGMPYAEKSMIYGYYCLLLTAFFGIWEIWVGGRKNLFEHVFPGKPIYHIPFFITLVFLTYISSIAHEKILFVHDSSLYFTKSEAFSHFGHLWRSDSFGYADYLVQAVSFFSNMFSLILFSIGASFTVSQVLVFFIALLSVWYGSWYAFKKTFELLKLKESLYSSFFASVLYTFNLYMIASWHGGTIVALFVVFAIAPPILFLLISFLIGDRSPLKVIVLSLCFGIVLGTAPYAGALFTALFIPFVLMQRRGVFWDNVKAIFSSGIRAFPFSAFFITTLSSAYLYSDPYPIRNNLTSYAFSDFGVSGIFRFFLEWTMNQSWGGRYFHSYYPYYTHWAVIASAFVLWIVATMVLMKEFLVSSYYSKRKKIVLFVFLVALLSIFISKADQAPLGDLNMFLYKHIPLFNMFRTPDTKFGLPLVLSLSFLVGYFLALSKGYAARLLVVAAIVLQVAPFFSTVPILEVRAGDGFQRAMVIPDGYNRIKDIVDGDNGRGFVLSLPGASYANFDYKNGTGLNGQDILGKLVDRPIVYGDNFIFGKSEKLYDDLSRNLHSARLADYGIRYVLVRKDILRMDTSEFSQKADASSNLEQVYSSNLGDLYKVKNASDSIISIQNGSGSVETRFLSDSSVQYVHIKGLEGKAGLVYLQSFHPGWKVYVGEKNCQLCLLWDQQLPDSAHHLVKDYANGWTVDPEYIKANFPKDSYHENPDGSIDADLTLYFKPQAYFYISLIVSGLALVGCLWYVWRSIKRKKDG